jgi:hypothetical protein
LQRIKLLKVTPVISVIGAAAMGRNLIKASPNQCKSAVAKKSLARGVNSYSTAVVQGIRTMP